MKKKILLIAVTFFSITVFSQKIYPSYPNQPIDDYQYLTQITYYDLNYISNRITKFLYVRNNMKDLTDKNIYNLKNGAGTISMPYIEMSSRGKQSKLMVTYNVFGLDGDFVVKSLKITGDYDKMVLFYVTFWNTKINVEKNLGVTNNYVQDLISFNNSIKNPIITIVNTTILDSNKFIVDYENKKKPTETTIKNSELPKVNIVENKPTKEISEVKKTNISVISSESIILKVKKRGTSFKFDTEIDDILKEKIKNYYSRFQDFNCTVTVTYDVLNDKIKDDTFFCGSTDCK